MHRLPLAAAALALIVATPALAQYKSPTRTAERPPVATTGYHTPTGASVPASHWHGSADEWRAHVSTCSARYRSYNPRTDTYVVRRGVERRCALAATVDRGGDHENHAPVETHSKR